MGKFKTRVHNIVNIKKILQNFDRLEHEIYIVNCLNNLQI